MATAKSETLLRKKRKLASSLSSSSASDSEGGDFSKVRNGSNDHRGLVNIEMAGHSVDIESSSSNLFRLDGLVPHMSPKLVRMQADLQARTKGAGRRRSEDKSILMELIDQSYPPLVCPVCFKVASGKSEADHHHKAAHGGSKPFACMHPSCKHTYRTKAGLRYHLDHAHTVSVVSDKSVQLVSQKKSPARKDSTTKTRKPELPEDLQQQLDARYNPTVCPACSTTFPRKTNVIHHLVQTHRGEEPYKCVVTGCKRNRSYATREGLVYHLASYHDDSAS